MHVAPINAIQPNAVTNQNQKQPPAQAARDLLQSRTDLADEPFGKLVSLFARGQPIPSAPINPNTTGATNLSSSDTTNQNNGGA
jgi:hypothetical protein